MGPMRSCIQPRTFRSASVRIITVNMTMPITAAIWASEMARRKLSSVTIHSLREFKAGGTGQGDMENRVISYLWPLATCLVPFDFHLCAFEVWHLRLRIHRALEESAHVLRKMIGEPGQPFRDSVPHLHVCRHVAPRIRETNAAPIRHGKPSG